jgi:hypothetical protein
MLKRYSDSPTIQSRAQQLWIMLVGKAANRQTTTYGPFAEKLGWEGSGTMGQFLAPIMYFCMENRLPSLTSLVVNQDTGLPGQGFGDVDPNRAREKVFAFAWHDIVIPSEQDLKEAFERGRLAHPELAGRS